MTTADQPGGYAAADTRSRKDKAAEKLTIPRSRGAVTGVVLVLLGIWAGLIHFVGPYFDYQADLADVWTFTWSRLWFGIVPGVAAIIAGLTLGPAADRVTANLATWLGGLAGIWLIIGPTLAEYWTNAGPSSYVLEITEAIGIYYGLGGVILGLSAFVMGRISVRSVKD